MDRQPETTQTVTGILEWPQKVDGRIRQLNGTSLILRDDDPFVPVALGDQYRLRDGLEVTVQIGTKVSRRKSKAAPSPSPSFRGGKGYKGGRPSHPSPMYHDDEPEGEFTSSGRRIRPVVESILAIEGMDPQKYAEARPFEELTSIDPQPRLTLEYPGCPASCRLIDLFCPIGRGQRGLIVSPPKAGKTTLLKDIATAILKNHADVELLVVLIDERPEEVTDFKRTFAQWTPSPPPAASPDSPDAPAGLDRGEPKPAHPHTAHAEDAASKGRCRVLASSNDHDADKHIRVALTALERTKRMVEAGKHVVVVLDSLTRLGRAFNRTRKYAGSGRTMTGGIDSKALEIPRQIFGAARNTEEAGSLTIIATCLVDTGSAGDQVIFEEFKGSGNMELILDRKISEKRLFPAINLAASGTRKEHLLMAEQELKTITALRRRLLNMPPHVQVEQLLAALQRFPTNDALVGSAG